jgi:hypothetical protein
MRTKKGTRCTFKPSSLWLCGIHWNYVGKFSIAGFLAVLLWVGSKIADTGWDVFVEEHLLRERPELVLEIDGVPIAEDTVFQVPATKGSITIDAGAYNKGNGAAENLLVVLRISVTASEWMAGNGWEFPKQHDGIIDVQAKLPSLPSNTRTQKELRVNSSAFLVMGANVYAICSKTRTKPHRIHFISSNQYTNYNRLNGTEATAYLNSLLNTNLPITVWMTATKPAEQ